MGLKYWGEYRDVNGLVFRAEIFVDSSNGVVSEMRFAEEAIKISYPEKEIYDPIFSCDAQRRGNISTFSQRRNEAAV